MRRWLVVLSMCGAGCAGNPSQQRCAETAHAPAAAMGRVPEFPWAALKGPHAVKVKVYVAPDGSFAKWTVHVTRAGMPEWVHPIADQELGKGEDVEYEVEQYASGDTVYELTRRVGGKRIEVSLRSTDHKRVYIERKDLELDALPAPVKQAVASVAGFVAKACSTKTYVSPASTLHEVEGELAGAPYTIFVTPEGKITVRRTTLTAEVKVMK